jgi:hypothetical protein
VGVQASELLGGPEVDEMASDGRDYFEVVWAQAQHTQTHSGNLARRQDQTGPDANKYK